MMQQFSRQIGLSFPAVVCLWSLGFCAASAGVLAAQDEPPTARPAVTAPGAGAADAGPATTEYQAKLKAWKELLKDLRDLTVRYQAAEQDEAVHMRQRWDELIAEGNQLIPSLRAAAAAAYREEPNNDRALTRLLVQMIGDEISKDKYDSAAELAKVMIENNCDLREVYNLAGVAAFVSNDFESAESYFNEANKSNALDQRGQNFRSELDNYKKYWEREQQLRREEAEADNLPRVKLTTSKGDIVIELFENEAPQTVGNFIYLVEQNFYDGLTFHRVLPGFMIQGGCPEGTGTGGPGYSIYCETDNENRRVHFRGTLSMAHAGKDTGGSQFFITIVPTPQLNGRHTAFGRVIEGMEVLAKIQRRDPSAPPPLPEPDTIIKAEVLRKGEGPYEPTKVQ